MGLAVNVLCRNSEDDRVIPRFSRYLRDHLGWHLTVRPVVDADVYYLSGYFEHPVMKGGMTRGRPVVAYFTHLEEKPAGNSKAKLFVELGRRVDLRIVTAAMYAERLVDFGPTVQVPPPVERYRFTIPKDREPGLVVGLSGYTYRNGRKGEALARRLVQSKLGQHLTWCASGRGWPVPTKRYPWEKMPLFYQELDILVVTSDVEGIPMPPLEALSCGVSVVIPRGVGLLDELPDVTGIHRYDCSSYVDLGAALSEAVEVRKNVNREALRAVTEPYTTLAWCEAHRLIFQELFL